MITVLAIGRRRGRARRRRAAIVQRWCSARIGEGLIYDLRRRAVRQGAADAGRVLHPHPDRGAHQPAQQRRRRRADGGHQHARQRRQQRHRPRHHARRDDRPRVADHVDGARRAAGVHHPGEASRQAAADHRPRADGRQRRDEQPDDRALQRVRRAAREAVRAARPARSRCSTAARRRVRDIGIASAMYGRVFFVALGLVGASAPPAVYGIGAHFVVDGDSPPARSSRSPRSSPGSTSRSPASRTPASTS